MLIIVSPKNFLMHPNKNVNIKTTGLDDYKKELIYRNVRRMTMGYRLQIHFSDGSSELIDEVFETKEDAEAEYDSWLENYSVGGETLKLAGEDYDDSGIEGYDIFEE